MYIITICFAHHSPEHEKSNCRRPQLPLGLKLSDSKDFNIPRLIKTFGDVIFLTFLGTPLQSDSLSLGRTSEVFQILVFKSQLQTVNGSSGHAKEVYNGLEAHYSTHFGWENGPVHTMTCIPMHFPMHFLHSNCTRSVLQLVQLVLPRIYCRNFATADYQLFGQMQLQEGALDALGALPNSIQVDCLPSEYRRWQRSFGKCKIYGPRWHGRQAVSTQSHCLNGSNGQLLEMVKCFSSWFLHPSAVPWAHLASRFSHIRWPRLLLG